MSKGRGGGEGFAVPMPGNYNAPESKSGKVPRAKGRNIGMPSALTFRKGGRPNFGRGGKRS